MQQIPFGEPKWLPKSIPGPFVSLLAPGFLQDRPQDASKSALGSLRGAKKNIGRAQGRPKRISQPFFALLKTEPPPTWGGAARSAPCVFSIFLENRCFRVGGVQKSRVQGLRGHSPGLGGEAKASPTTSFACCLKLRFAKLEAPLRGAGPGLTTARPVGRRISGPRESSTPLGNGLACRFMVSAYPCAYPNASVGPLGRPSGLSPPAHSPRRTPQAL